MTPQTDVVLASLTTMQVGGAARWFAAVETESSLCAALSWAEARAVPTFILGGGSNVVISDAGFPGLVIQVRITGTDVHDAHDCLRYSVGAGEVWDPFVETTVRAGVAGLECLSGIPGSVGGTPVQNVGAYGQEVSGTLTRVHVVAQRTGQRFAFANAECGFGYRTSRFKQDDAGRFVVTRVDFSLRRDGAPTVAYADLVTYFEQKGVATPTVADVRSATLDVRRRKGMVIEPESPVRRSCGSFFVNPVVGSARFAAIQAQHTPDRVPHFVIPGGSIKIPAAWLIERAGFARGWTRGPVGISPLQAQAIVNLGGAQAADVLTLAHDVKQAVVKTFGIWLMPEPQFIGFGASPELRRLMAAGE